MVNASPMIVPTVMRGLSEANGSWKMICMSRQSARNAPMCERADVLALKPDFAGGRLDQAQDAAAGGRFAGAGFADEAERLALLDVEADAVDGMHDGLVAQQEAGADVELLGQVPDREQRRAHCGRRPRFENAGDLVPAAEIAQASGIA